jgi:hypothetical protein
MFEFLIIACVVFNVDGTPTNACYPFGNEEYYQTELECREEAQIELKRVSSLINRDFPRAIPVAAASCRQISEQL